MFGTVPNVYGLRLAVAVESWAVVRMDATPGSSAACRCRRRRCHHAGLRPAWSLSGRPARGNAAPVADHGHGRCWHQLRRVAVPGEARHCAAGSGAPAAVAARPRSEELRIGEVD